MVHMTKNAVISYTAARLSEIYSWTPDKEPLLTKTAHLPINHI